MKPNPFDAFKASTLIAGVVGVVFGLIFVAVGISVISWLWGSSSHGMFGPPPLIFRLIGTLISLAFVVGGVAFGAQVLLPILIASRIADAARTRRELLAEKPAPASTPVGYVCPKCGAALASEAEVSPLGDVKCAFCQQWFNIHKPTS